MEMGVWSSSWGSGLWRAGDGCEEEKPARRLGWLTLHWPWPGAEDSPCTTLLFPCAPTCTVAVLRVTLGQVLSKRSGCSAG